MASDMELAHVLTSLSPKDWRAGQSAATTTQLVLDGLAPGRIILLHDRANQGETVRAVPDIIDGARGRGYCFGVVNSRGNVVRPVPVIRVRKASVVEGSGGSRVEVEVWIRLNFPTSTRVTVDYTTLDGTALAGSDYRARSGTVTFEPGQYKKPVTVRIIADNRKEPDETFRLRISNPVNGTLGRRTATITILDDD